MPCPQASYTYSDESFVALDEPKKAKLNPIYEVLNEHI